MVIRGMHDKQRIVKAQITTMLKENRVLKNFIIIFDIRKYKSAIISLVEARDRSAISHNIIEVVP